MGNKKVFNFKDDIDINLKKKRMTALFLSIILLLFVLLLFAWIKYEVEGVKGVSFEIEEILVVSTADGKRISNKKANKKDTFEVSQVNDVYIKIKEIGKDNYSLNKISITNFVLDEPKKGEILILEPTGDIPDLFSNSKKNYINDTIEYKASKVDDLEKLETANNGETIAFRIENKLGSYAVKKDDVLTYDSTLLNRFTDNVEDIKFKLSFDLIIELENGLKLLTNIELEKPTIEIFNENKTIVIEDITNLGFKKI